MRINTASQTISFAKDLENESAKFYDVLSARFEKQQEVFRSFAAENKKNIVQIERVYYGVITDAIESCFAFDIDPNKYKLDTNGAKISSFADALKQAIVFEETISKFYRDAANQSKSTMADVPRAFMLIARKRDERIERLTARSCESK